MSIPQPDDGIKEGDSVIGTDENRAVLHVEVIFWSGKRKIPPSLVSGKYCPHFVVTGTTEYLGVCFLDGTECTFDTPAFLAFFDRKGKTSLETMLQRWYTQLEKEYRNHIEG